MLVVFLPEVLQGTTGLVGPALTMATESLPETRGQRCMTITMGVYQTVVHFQIMIRDDGIIWAVTVDESPLYHPKTLLLHSIQTELH